MNRKRYRQLRAAAALCIAAIVAVAVNSQSYLLATAGVVSGMLFMALVRAKAKIRTDERELLMQEKAARITYIVFAPTLGILAFLLLLPAKGGMSVFSKGDWLYIESIGMILAYTTLLLMVLYAACYYFLNRKFSANHEE